MNLEPASRATDTQAPLSADVPASIQGAGAAAPRMQNIQKKFVIFASPQTSSSRLVAMLDQHPSIRCLGEVFNPKGTVLEQFGLRTRKVITQAGQAPVEFLNRFVAQVDEKSAGKSMFGFKMMLHHDPRMIDYFVDDPEWAVVVLERRDLLAQWTETALAKKSGRWESGGIRGKRLASKDKDDVDDFGDDDEDDFLDDEDGSSASAGSGGTAAPQRKVVFDPWRYEQFGFRQQARYESIYHRLAKRSFFKLLSEDMDASYPALQEFLGVEPTPLREPPPPLKATSMRECIDNFDVFERYAKKNSLTVR
jgi:hypothetical protein